MSADKPTAKLTHRQEKFARGVASGLSQSDAYRSAYPVSKLWKDDSVHNKASALMRHAQVSATVLELSKKVEDKFVVDTVDLLREAMRLGMSDVRKLSSADGKVLLPYELDDDTARAVSSFEIDEYGRIKYKFWDKNVALEKLFKHRGLFKVDHEQSVDPVRAILEALSGRVVRPVALDAEAAEDDDE